MDADSWAARLSSASRRYQSVLQSRSGMKWDGLNAEMLMGFEEIDMDDDVREEYPCPFCSEYFDIVGLCCHIDDEHPVEAKNGVCPICAMRVDITCSARENHVKGGSHSTLSLLRRELREGNLHSLFGGSSCVVSSSNAAPDPLLSSFILPVGDDFMSVQSHSSESIPVKKSSAGNVLERKVREAPMSIKDQEEKAQRCAFVQGMLLSTILDDDNI
ncbi:Protein DEHYDRATION-INDUCED [Abeliophyllum distichum]|uniref:Protein DEHYDRATION-INDUCED n=1 Tax=Abeliophyllum distichum TaxID=126358 RepID=A0ABD1RUA8_9LAMI